MRLIKIIDNNWIGITQLRVGMEYSILVAKEKDIRDLLNNRNNKDLFAKYLKQQEEEYLVVAEGDKTLLGFGLLKLMTHLRIQR